MDITKEEILDYCTTSPENTNRNYLNDLLTQFEEGVLPEVTEEDNGKILKVSDGAWDKGTETKELPEVTSADNGKVLGVANGAWGKIDAPSGGDDVFYVTLTENSYEDYSCDKTYAEIRDAINQHKRVVGFVIKDSGNTIIQAANFQLSQYSGTVDINTVPWCGLNEEDIQISFSTFQIFTNNSITCFEHFWDSSMMRNM